MKPFYAATVATHDLHGQEILAPIAWGVGGGDLCIAENLCSAVAELTGIV